MLWLILILAGGGHPMNTMDLETRRLYEIKVAATVDHRIIRAEFSDDINQLGSPHWKEREAAFGRLRLMGSAPLRGLVRAVMFHPDPEVRNSCNRLIYRLYDCPYCRGTGECPRCQDYKGLNSGCYYSECTKCSGTGKLMR